MKNEVLNLLFGFLWHLSGNSNRVLWRQDMTYFILVFTTFNFFTNTPEVHSVEYKFRTYEACQIARHIKTSDPNKLVLKAECQEREDNG